MGGKWIGKELTNFIELINFIELTNFIYEESGRYVEAASWWQFKNQLKKKAIASMGRIPQFS